MSKRGKKANTQKKTQTPQSSTSNEILSTSITEEKTEKVYITTKEYESLKKSASDLDEFLFDETKALEQYKNDGIKSIDEEIANEYNERIKAYEEAERALKNDAIILENKIQEKQKELNIINTEIQDKKNESNKIITDSKKEAEEEKTKILDDAKMEIDKKRKELEQEQKKAKQQIDAEKEKIEWAREIVEEEKKIWKDSNPEALDRLKDELNRKEESLAWYKENVNELQRTIEKFQYIETRYEGKSVEDLANEVETLKRLNESLKTRLEQYNDQEISEWKSAYDEFETIVNELELLRRENLTLIGNKSLLDSKLMELGQLKEQIDTLKALNDHLRKELESNKTALESRTGDSCPALSEVDANIKSGELPGGDERRTRAHKLSSLKEIVSHVKNYAGKKENLYYSENTIRAFLSGLAVSRLSILQGMSGTGKSSLPRIFMDAINGTSYLIPVESSWRDRHELLGYYNDFNKKFNAKKFVIDLYRSNQSHYNKIPTFLILDEMNLARIEYYFSDFLSIMEDPEPDNWKIDLVPFDLRTLPMELDPDIQFILKDNNELFDIWERLEKIRQGDGSVKVLDHEKNKLYQVLGDEEALTGPKNLINGKTIKIPGNVWFIGTVNKDESTFEISDKVYDRSQVITLDQKGILDCEYKDQADKFIDSKTLNDLLDEGKISLTDKEKDKVIELIEEIDEKIILYFDTSFGNRIVNQAIDFTATFLAAGGKNIEEALDYQISSKILRKVIGNDNKDLIIKFRDELGKRKYPFSQAMLNKRINELNSSF